MRGPETQRAILWCRNCDRPTRHIFLEYREGRGGRTQYDLAFICTVVVNDSGGKCGQVRVWGNENANSFYGSRVKDSRSEMPEDFD